MVAPPGLIELKFNDWKNANDDTKGKWIALGTIFKMPGEFQRMCNVSDSIAMALYTSEDGRLKLSEWISYRKALSHYFEKQYKTPKAANEDDRYAQEYVFYNAVTPDQEGVTLEEFGTLNHKADEATGPRIAAYE